MIDEPRLALWLLSNVATALAGFFSRDLFRVVKKSVQAFWSECKIRRRHQERMQFVRESFQHEIHLRNIDLDSEKIRTGMVSGYAYDVPRTRDAQSQTNENRD